MKDRIGGVALHYRRQLLPGFVALVLVGGVIVSIFGSHGAQADLTNGCGYGYGSNGVYGNGSTYGYGYVSGVLTYGYGNTIGTGGASCSTTTTTPAGSGTTTPTAPPAPVLPSSDYTDVATYPVSSNGSLSENWYDGLGGEVTLSGSAGTLTAGTSISLSMLTTAGKQAAAALLPSGNNFVFGMSMTWVNSSGSSVNANHPITLTIANPNIKVGDIIWMVDSTGKLVNVGTATVAGSITASFTQDPLFIVAHSTATTTTTTTPTPPVMQQLRAIRAFGFGVAGRITTMRIVGVGFYGQPRVTSTAPGTRVGVTHDYGRQLVLRVMTKAGSPKGAHTFTIRLANGRTCRINYMVR
ncbi:MAG: hypothetical protein HIU84_07530 [Acidobacteria bacterium]|nr:hypothetical protein [Acidobacteriota bacterium]